MVETAPLLSSSTPASPRNKDLDPAFRYQIAIVLKLCEECVTGWETEYKDQLICSMKRIKLAARFWDHLSEKDRMCIANDDSISMAQADVEMEMAKVRYKADVLARKRKWTWWRTEKYMKKWLGLLQTASQLEFSFQGLCRQVMHEQESTLIATKLLSDAGLHIRSNTLPDAATLMTHPQPGFHQVQTQRSQPNSPASPAGSPTSANALPLSMSAAIRGSPSECGANVASPSVSRTSSLGPSGFLATPLSAESLSPTSAGPPNGLSDFLEPSLAQLPDSLAVRPASPTSLFRDITAASSPSPTFDHRHGPGHLPLSGLSISNSMLVSRPGLKIRTGDSRESSARHDDCSPRHQGSTFKTPRDAAGAVLGPGWGIPGDLAATGVHGGLGSPGLPCEHDIERLGTLEKKAAQGSADAQYEVACMLLEGRGVPRDRDFGVAWLKCDASTPV